MKRLGMESKGTISEKLRRCNKNVGKNTGKNASFRHRAYTRWAENSEQPPSLRAPTLRAEGSDTEGSERTLPIGPSPRPGAGAYQSARGFALQGAVKKRSSNSPGTSRELA